jgi:hypothetical protein
MHPPHLRLCSGIFCLYFPSQSICVAFSFCIFFYLFLAPPAVNFFTFSPTNNIFWFPRVVFFFYLWTPPPPAWTKDRMFTNSALSGRGGVCPFSWWSTSSSAAPGTRTSRWPATSLLRLVLSVHYILGVYVPVQKQNPLLLKNDAPPPLGIQIFTPQELLRL